MTALLDTPEYPVTGAFLPARPGVLVTASNHAGRVTLERVVEWRSSTPPVGGPPAPCPGEAR